MFYAYRYNDDGSLWFIEKEERIDIPKWCELDENVTISDIAHEEIKTEKATRLENESKAKAKEDRAILLKQGTITADGRMWFNFDSADMFMNAVGTLDADETIKWYDKNRQIVELTYDEAKAYSKEIRLVMQSLYGLK